MISTTSRPAIGVKFYPPTKTKDARLKCIVSSMVYRWYPYTHEGDSEDEHVRACGLFLDFLGWSGDYVGAKSSKGSWVFVEVSQMEVL